MRWRILSYNEQMKTYECEPLRGVPPWASHGAASTTLMLAPRFSDDANAPKGRDSVGRILTTGELRAAVCIAFAAAIEPEDGNG